MERSLHGNEAHANGVEPAWERGSCQWSGACMGMRLMPMEWSLHGNEAHANGVEPAWE